MQNEINEEEIEKFLDKLKEDSMTSGYHINPDIDITRKLGKGLLINKKRYGYQACPCRLAMGNKNEDVDIICPCDYRDADLNQYGACYCGLYVSQMVLKGEQKIEPIPERRLPREERKSNKKQPMRNSILLSLNLPIWRCRVCGYLCAREEPPEVCPICKAGSERFEKFL